MRLIEDKKAIDKIIRDEFLCDDIARVVTFTTPLLSADYESFSMDDLLDAMQAAESADEYRAIRDEISARFNRSKSK